MKSIQCEPVDYMLDVSFLELEFSSELIDKVSKVREFIKNSDLDVSYVSINAQNYKLLDESGDISDFKEQCVELNVFSDVIYPNIISKFSGDSFECSGIEISNLT